VSFAVVVIVVVVDIVVVIVFDVAVLILRWFPFSHACFNGESGHLVQYDPWNRFGGNLAQYVWIPISLFDLRGRDVLLSQ